jgi:hypothetical protein
MSLKVIGRVQGCGGSARLYEHQTLGLVEVTVTQPSTDGAAILEVERHPQAMRPKLLAYFADMQSYLRTLEKRSQKRSAGGAS